MDRGGDYDNQLIQYNIANHQLTDYGEDYLLDTMGNSNGECGGGGYYSQLNSTMLYTIAYPNGDYIHSYNLQTLSYQQLSASIPTSVSYYACLASSETPSPRLYVTGGEDDDYNALDDLQVLDLNQSQWLTNMPSMQYSRHSHGCIVVDERLFVVGGDVGVTAIENMNIMDIDSASWDTIGNIPEFRYEFGQLIAFQEVIYVVGGYHGDEYLDTVYAIDIMNTTMVNVTLLPDTLPYSVGRMGTVIVDNTIYGFGGYDSDNIYGLDTWISYEMLSAETQTECKSNSFSLIDDVVIDRPTASPTNEPSQPPSIPTQIPTDSPTSPTFSPSTSPTPNTKPPSTTPAASPSIAPTIAPSWSPTASPSFAPTNPPSTDPTLSPSVNPTAEPTTDPTYVPTTEPTVKGQCEGYQSCSECVTVGRADSGPDKIWCEWHSIDDYCYNFYTQPGDDDKYGIDEESNCHDASDEYILLAIVGVGAVSLCIAVILCIVYRDTLCMEWKLKSDPIHKEGAYDGLMEMPPIDNEGDGPQETQYHMLREDSYTADDGVITGVPAVIPSAPYLEVEMGNIPSCGSPRGSVVLEHDPLIDTLLERAAEYGEYWRDVACNGEMLEEWTSYYVPNLERIRDGMRGRSDHYECHDDECKWTDDQTTVLFPHQNVHGLIYHSQGMLH